MTCNLTGDMIYMLIPYKFIINHMNDIPAFVQETNDNLHKAFRTSHTLKQGIIPAFLYRVRKWLRNNKLSRNIVKKEFTESTPHTTVVEGQEVKRVKPNNKWPVVAMVTALASYFYF